MTSSLLRAASLTITIFIVFIVFLPYPTLSMDSNSPQNSPSPSPSNYPNAPPSISLPPSEAEAPLSPFPAPIPLSLPLPPPLSLPPLLSPLPSDLAPSPSPSSDDNEDPADGEHSPSPPPITSGGVQHADQSAAGDLKAEDPSGGMSGGRKAGVAFGVIAAGGVVVLGVMVYKKRQHNIRRSQYGHVARRDFL